MDPLSVILFLLCFGFLLSIWRQQVNSTLVQQRHADQLARIVSDMESEKDTRRRSNSHINQQLSALGRMPLPADDCEKKD